MLKICAVTGSRAEFGLLKKLLLLMHADNDIDLQLIATGMHLAPEFGSTWREIEASGLKITKKIDMLVGSESKGAVSKSMGVALISFSDAFEELKPDLILVLGDRFEMLSAGIAAMIQDIPIAHLHGGEITLGIYDDPIRHSLTKMSLLHFVATDEYKKRVIQLGENPDRVFNVGAFGLDVISERKFQSKKQLELEYGFDFSRKYLLVTFHAETMTDNDPLDQLNELLKAISYSQLNAVFTMANADNEGRLINNRIRDFTQSNPSKYIFIESMGSIRYLSALKHSECILGNSSSGLIEAPSFGKPTVNVGARQGGRIKSQSVIDCNATAAEIMAALDAALSPKFKKKSRETANLYGGPGAAEKTLEIIKKWSGTPRRKEFFDL